MAEDKEIDKSDKGKRFFRTQSGVDGIPKPPKGQQAIYWDTDSPLGLRVSPKGAKTFFVVLWIGEKGKKKVRRAHVGRYDPKTFTLAEARKVARSYRTLAANNKDPTEEAERERQQGEEEAKRLAEELARKDQEAFANVQKEFLKKYCGIGAETDGAKQGAKKAHIPIRPSTAKEYKRILTSGRFSDWAGKPIRTITAEDVNAILDPLLYGEPEKGKPPRPIMANRFHAVLRKLFYWAKDKRGYLDTIPKLTRPVPKEKGRKRILTDSELVEVWEATDKRGAPFGPLIKLMILTGQRRGEVAGAQWSEFHDLDGEAPVWKIPGDRTKNGEPHDVPLAPQAVAIVKNLDREVFKDNEGKEFKSPLCFPTEGKKSASGFSTTGKKPVSGFSNVKEALDKDIQAARDEKAKNSGREVPAETMPGWTMHDLRRTMTSGMARLKVLPHVLEKILNHKRGEISGVAAVYNRHDYGDEARSALNLWAAYVESLVSGKPEDNVHYLNTAAAS